MGNFTSSTCVVASYPASARLDEFEIGIRSMSRAFYSFSLRVDAGEKRPPFFDDPTHHSHFAVPLHRVQSTKLSKGSFLPCAASPDPAQYRHCMVPPQNLQLFIKSPWAFELNAAAITDLQWEQLFRFPDHNDGTGTRRRS